MIRGLLTALCSLIRRNQLRNEAYISQNKAHLSQNEPHRDQNEAQLTRMQRCRITFLRIHSEQGHGSRGAWRAVVSDGRCLGALAILIPPK